MHTHPERGARRYQRALFWRHLFPFVWPGQPDEPVLASPQATAAGSRHSACVDAAGALLPYNSYREDLAYCMDDVLCLSQCWEKWRATMVEATRDDGRELQHVPAAAVLAGAADLAALAALATAAAAFVAPAPDVG